MCEVEGAIDLFEDVDDDSAPGEMGEGLVVLLVLDSPEQTDEFCLCEGREQGL